MAEANGASAGQSARWRMIAVLALPPLFWAGNFIVARGIRDDLPPVTLSFLRCLVSLVFILPFAWIRVRPQLGWYKAHWKLVFLVGLPGVTVFNTLVYFGLQQTSATNGMLLNSTTPALILVLGALLWHRPIRGIQILGVLLSTFGVGVIILHGEWHRLVTLQFSQGDLIIFVAMICWALYTLGLTMIPANVDKIGLLGVQMLMAVVVLLPFLIWSLEVGPAPVWSLSSLGAIAYIGIVPSLIAFILFMRAVSLAGPALAGQAIHLLPVYGAALAALFLGEELHLYHAIGFITILGGIVVASLGRAPAKKG